MKYLVQWEIEVEADDPLAAAQAAHDKRIWPSQDELNYTVYQETLEPTKDPTFEVNLFDRTVAQVL